MTQFRLGYQFLRHFFSARHTGGFGVHSPFLFHFTRFVLHEKHPFSIFATIEKLRSRLKGDKRVLEITDYGTGSGHTVSVSSIAARSLQTAKYGQLLYRMVHYFKARQVLELGTSLGITTSYLASSSTEIKCVSLEGCPQIAGIARENFKQLGLSNVSVVIGNIDTTLEQALASMPQLDFVFVDANHRSEAVVRYFEQCLPKVHKETVIVFDDIYWSADMQQAWAIIKDHPQVTSTIDLFQFGIAFFNTDLYKKHYKMRY